MPAHHAAVDRAHHWVVVGGGAERALVRDDGERRAARLGVRGKAVRGERVGHRGERRLERTVHLARRHPLGQRSAVLLTDRLRQRLGLVGRQRRQRAPEQRGEQVVPTGREVERLDDG